MKLWHEDFGKTKDGQSVTRWLMENGHIPSFCTACYRAGHKGGCAGLRRDAAKPCILRNGCCSGF